MNTRPIVLITLGVAWLAADLNMMVGNVSLRETRLGVIAQFIGRLPPRIANPIFLLLWTVMLLGWIVPLMLGFRWLLRKKRSH
jgi:hypothetical protein